MAFDWTDLIAPSIGALVGSMAGESSTTTTAANRDPWAPAQPYLLNNLKVNSDLQSYYAKNPFNQMQKEGYQNQQNDINNFRNSIAPNLMNFSNGLMGSNYQRTSYDRPGAAYGVRQVVNQAPSGLLATNPGVFSTVAAPSAQIDWGAMQGGLPTQDGITEVINQLNGKSPVTPDRFTSGGGSGHGDGPSFGGGTPSEVSNQLGWAGFNADVATKALAANPVAAAIAGLLGGITSTPTLSAEAVAREDANRERAADRARADAGLANALGGFGSDAGMGAAESGSGLNGTGLGGGYGDSPGEGNRGGGGGGGDGNGGDGASGGSRGGDSSHGDGFYKGGQVKKKNLKGPDPKGPDQGSAPLQSGEYVIKKDMVKKYGKGLLADINSGKFKG